MTDRNGQNRGQPSSPKHAGAKLDEAAVLEMRRLHAEGWSTRCLALAFDVSLHASWRCVAKKSYRLTQGEAVPTKKEHRKQMNARAEAHARETTRGFLAEALAEREFSKGPLVMPTMAQRLRDELPGSVLRDSEERWSPSRYEVLDRATGRLLGAGATEREAVDRAVMLWGRR